MNLKYIFSLVIALMAVSTVLVVTGELKSEVNTVENSRLIEQKKVNERIQKIMTSGEYLGSRAENIEGLVNSGKEITQKSVGIVFAEWLRSAQRRDGDFSLIHFTPNMLSEENKDKFNTAIQGINREEVIDKLKALDIVIDHSSEKITGVFWDLINPKFGMFAKSDMSIHWLEYFLSKKNVDVNNWEKRTPMGGAIYTKNYDVAKLLIKYGYKPNDKDFESIQRGIVEVKEDDTATVDQEKSLEALSQIETLLMDNIKNRAPEPPPSRGFFD